MSAWQLHYTPYESEIDIISDGRVIATVEAGEDKEEIASLIVAAPDMLEALESVLSLIDESLGVAGYHLNGEVATWEELAIREELEAAIQKARGERYCHSEYGSANCKWEPGRGCTPKCPECIP